MAEHRSIERALVQIFIPRMSNSELKEIVNKGLSKLAMTITSTALDRIATLSHRLPHYTHSLALHSAQSAIDRDSKKITEADVTSAIKITIDQAQQSIITNYHKATNSPRGNLYAEVLLACALAETDELVIFQRRMCVLR